MVQKVAFARILEYESTLLDATVGLLLDETGLSPARGDRILVKPNLVAGMNASLSCTHPLVVRAACSWLLDHGARVVVGDSPAFGPASFPGKKSGLVSALQPLGIKLKSLGAPKATQLPCGIEIGISRDALETNLILNLPKLKAHTQMRVTGAVKNLFGCVVGFRKALAHNRHGDKPKLFNAMIMEIRDQLPPTRSLMDAIRPMHVTGPIKGEPFTLCLLAASDNDVALDTAIYSLLGLKPGDVPLWAEAVRRETPGWNPKDIHYTVEPPKRFNASEFRVPEELTDLHFDPFRLAQGRLKGLMNQFIKK